MNRRDQSVDLDEFGRFAEPALLILISLADGAKHGYAVTEDIAAFADVRFGPGTLYAAIARLEARGLIGALDADDRRNPYELTTLEKRRYAPGWRAFRPSRASARSGWRARDMDAEAVPTALAPAVRRGVSRPDRATAVFHRHGIRHHRRRDRRVDPATVVFVASRGHSRGGRQDHACKSHAVTVRRIRREGDNR